MHSNGGNMINERYYEGFEGDEEILLRLYVHDKEIEQLGVWSGYFNSIVQTIKPQKDGWTGLAYYYHLAIGWYDEENWVVPDLRLFYEQLMEVDEKLLVYNEDREVLHLLRCLFEKAIEKQGRITISSY